MTTWRLAVEGRGPLAGSELEVVAPSGGGVQAGVGEVVGVAPAEEGSCLFFSE